MDISARSPDIFDALLKRRQILLQGEVDVDIQMKITRLIPYLNALGNAPITLLIDSVGGTTEISLHICDAIAQSEAVVRGIVMADALSAGFRIFQSCHERLAYPRARLMFHGTSMRGVRIDSKVWRENFNQAKELHEEQLGVYAKRSNQPMKRLREWSRNEKLFTAAEALRFGFLDEIVKPPKK